MTECTVGGYFCYSFASLIFTVISSSILFITILVLSYTFYKLPKLRSEINVLFLHMFFVNLLFIIGPSTLRFFFFQMSNYSSEYCKATKHLIKWLGNTSSMFLVVICLERFFLIVQPTIYQNLLYYKVNRYFILGNYIINFIIACAIELPFEIEIDKQFLDGHLFEIKENDPFFTVPITFYDYCLVKNKTYLILSFLNGIIFEILIVPVMIYVYWQIYKTIKESHKNLQHPSNTEPSSNTTSREIFTSSNRDDNNKLSIKVKTKDPLQRSYQSKERTILLTACLICAIYIVFIFPIVIEDLLEIFLLFIDLHFFKLSKKVLTIFFLLSAIYPAVEAIIFFLFNKLLRKEFLSLINK